MAKRIVVDPITRIEGHLRIEAMLDDRNQIKDAMSSGTMWRGIEVILQGRDPRDAWAFAERICGVCTTVHALASVRAVENAVGINIPQNADIIRNIMFLTQMVQDHVIHFYHLHALDWVDVVSALKADPRKTSDLQQLVSPSHPRSAAEDARDRRDHRRLGVPARQLLQPGLARAPAPGRHRGGVLREALEDAIRRRAISALQLPRPPAVRDQVRF